MKFKEILERKIINIVKIIFLFIIFYLFIYSIKYTCSVTVAELTIYNNDSIAKNIFYIIISVIICMSIAMMRITFDKKKKNNIIKIIKATLCVVSVVFTIFAIVWIISTQLIPRVDQKYVMNTALNMISGNFSDFEKGGYIYIYPNQSGIVLFIYFCVWIFGNTSHILIQLLNVLCLIISYYYIYKISKIIFKDKNKILPYLILLSLFLYIQMAFYTTFVYGNIFGLMFSIIGIYFELKYFETEKISNIIISCICITLAIIIKSNYLITLIAMVLVLIFEAIFKKKYKSLIFVAIMIICYVFGNKFVELSIEKITNKELSRGVPKLAWIEMGLQEGGYAPGWYNEYNRNVFVQNDYDTDKANEQVKKDLKETLKGYSHDLNGFLDYMTAKIISQWINPTFQCFWINQNRETDIDMPNWSKSIIEEAGSYKYLVEYMDIAQTLILFGALLYITINFTKIEFNELFLAIVFIGGFLFHILWEAKCQYTITYFILLIPYSIIGYSKFIEKIKDKIETTGHN